MEILFIVILLICCMSTINARRNRLNSYRKIISDALADFLVRPEGSFIIIEEAESQKFVQFAVTREDPILFDLPTNNFNYKEMERAETLFKKLGYPGPEIHRLQEYPGGPDAGVIITFNVGFKDIDKATELAIAVFTKVFRMGSGARLVVHEG